MSSGRVTFLIVVVAVVAIIAVVVLKGGGDDEQPSGRAETGLKTSESQYYELTSTIGDEPPPPEREIPDDPDEVRGSDSFSLTRPANLRRALATLERERQPVEGIYDGLRVAPGRIDTVIVHPDDRRTNIQVRPDFGVSFKTTHDFPTPADFREDGITARDVDVAAPARMLRAIDRIRDGSAATDVDYLVIDRDIIDGGINLGAYMRIRTARPRMFSQEQGQALRPIG